MKKLLIAGMSTIIYLGYITAAFAQQRSSGSSGSSGAPDLNPCAGVTTGPGQGWNNVLCGLGGSNFGNTLRLVITSVFVLAVLIALFFLIYGGIKWITSGGDKAKVDGARSQIIAAIVGLIIVFLSFFIIQVLLGVFGLSTNANLTVAPVIPNSSSSSNSLPTTKTLRTTP